MKNITVSRGTCGRVLVFPASVAVVTALAGCRGVSVTDPSVRICKGADTVEYTAPSDSNITIRVILPAETPERNHCRKAA